MARFVTSIIHNSRSEKPPNFWLFLWARQTTKDHRQIRHRIPTPPSKYSFVLCVFFFYFVLFLVNKINSIKLNYWTRPAHPNHTNTHTHTLCILIKIGWKIKNEKQRGGHDRRVPNQTPKNEYTESGRGNRAAGTKTSDLTTSKQCSHFLV